ncbi:MAG: GNAT family protein [Pseudomonadota bacterium]
MFFSFSPPGGSFDPVLVHDPVILRSAAASDFEEWRDLREASREHLIQWEDNWRAGRLSRQAFKRRLKTQSAEMRRGGGLYLLSYRASDSSLIGGVTLTNIRYGAARSALLGYWVGAPFIRQGFGAASVQAMLAHAFERIGLNRVVAACQPENAASQQLLQRCGFQHEGLARDYLKINGQWRDHLIFARIAADYREAARSAATPKNCDEL